MMRVESEYAKPTIAAERVLEELGINGPRDLELLEEIAWARGAVVRRKNLGAAEARIVVLKNRAIITISSMITDPNRIRFSIAHELGHLELHRHRNFLSLCLSDDIDRWDLDQVGKRLEKEANQFAASLLLPEQFFAPLCRGSVPSLNYIAEIAEDFKVSLTATALRYTEFCEEPVAVIFSQDGYTQWFRGSEYFKDLGVFIEVRSRVAPSTCAASLFEGYRSLRKASSVDAASWFAPGGYRPDASIQEQSIAMPRINAVLTLLWVDDDIEEEDIFVTW